MTAAADLFSEEAGESLSPRDILHWYDLLCPFCYIGQSRNAIFEHHGFRVVDLPFEAHPDIPAGGRVMPARTGPIYDRLEAEARAAGLPLSWPSRLPNSRMALAAAEWVRRQSPRAFPPFQRALFAAHFALGEDIGDRQIILGHAIDAGVDPDALTAALDDGGAYRFVERSEMLAREFGVRGTPAWFVAGRLIPGLYPAEQFERLAQALADASP